MCYCTDEVRSEPCRVQDDIGCLTLLSEHSAHTSFAEHLLPFADNFIVRTDYGNIVSGISTLGCANMLLFRRSAQDTDPEPGLVGSAGTSSVSASS